MGGTMIIGFVLGATSTISVIHLYGWTLEQIKNFKNDKES